MAAPGTRNKIPPDVAPWDKGARLRIPDDPNSIDARELSIRPGSPWENAYIESFNGRLRDELLNGEIFIGLAEARYLVERCRVDSARLS